MGPQEQQEGASAETSHYSEQSTLRIGESLDTTSVNSSQPSKSRHRRLSGSAAESSIIGEHAGGRGPASVASSAASINDSAGGYRRRSLSDSRSNNARSSGKHNGFDFFYGSVIT